MIHEIRIRVGKTEEEELSERGRAWKEVSTSSKKIIWSCVVVSFRLLPALLSLQQNTPWCTSLLLLLLLFGSALPCSPFSLLSTCCCLSSGFLSPSSPHWDKGILGWEHLSFPPIGCARLPLALVPPSCHSSFRLHWMRPRRGCTLQQPVHRWERGDDINIFHSACFLFWEGVQVQVFPCSCVITYSYKQRNLCTVTALRLICVCLLYICRHLEEKLWSGRLSDRPCPRSRPACQSIASQLHHTSAGHWHPTPAAELHINAVALHICFTCVWLAGCECGCLGWCISFLFFFCI